MLAEERAKAAATAAAAVAPREEAPPLPPPGEEGPIASGLSWAESPRATLDDADSAQPPAPGGPYEAFTEIRRTSCFEASESRSLDCQSLHLVSE